MRNEEHVLQILYEYVLAQEPAESAFETVRASVRLCFEYGYEFLQATCLELWQQRKACPLFTVHCRL